MSCLKSCAYDLWARTYFLSCKIMTAYSSSGPKFAKIVAWDCCWMKIRDENVTKNFKGKAGKQRKNDCASKVHRPLWKKEVMFKSMVSGGFLADFSVWILLAKLSKFQNCSTHGINDFGCSLVANWESGECGNKTCLQFIDFSRLAQKTKIDEGQEKEARLELLGDTSYGEKSCWDGCSGKQTCCSSWISSESHVSKEGESVWPHDAIS